MFWVPELPACTKPGDWTSLLPGLANELVGEQMGAIGGLILVFGGEGVAFDIKGRAVDCIGPLTCGVSGLCLSSTAGLGGGDEVGPLPSWGSKSSGGGNSKASSISMSLNVGGEGVVDGNSRGGENSLLGTLAADLAIGDVGDVSGLE